MKCLNNKCISFILLKKLNFDDRLHPIFLNLKNSKEKKNVESSS